MSCSCGGTQNVVVENYRTCISCGLCSEYCPTYVMSYNNPRTYYRKCYYSRIKRFQKKLREMRSDLISEHAEDILLLYGRLEFAWNNMFTKKRKYFFSQKVVMYFLLKILEIDIAVPLLKNKDRTKEQLESMVKLLPENVF